MRPTVAHRHDEAMNDIHEPPADDPGGATTTESPSDDAGFDPQRLRTIADMQRSSDPRLVAGVCTGVARYLRIDPILVRIVFAVLIFVGGAGIILYAAIWFFVPSDDADVSIAADWFHLGSNEEKIRVGGLVLAAVVAVLSVVGDSGWGWGGGAPWGLVPLALLVYLFFVRPRRRREARAAATAAALQSPTHETVEDGVVTRTYQLPPERRSWSLTVLTLSVTAIAIAIARIIADSRDGTSWTTYVAIALGIVGLGVLISTLVGDGGFLIVLGLVLSVALGLGTLLPTPRIGAQELAPTTAAGVSTTYEHGIGLLVLDLTEVEHPEALLGRTVNLDAGVGQTRVILPNGLNVAVAADLRVGETTVFDRTVNGTDNRLDTVAEPGRSLTLSIDQKIGNIEVIRQ